MWFVLSLYSVQLDGAWKLFWVGTPPPCVFGDRSACHGLAEGAGEPVALQDGVTELHLIVCLLVRVCFSVSAKAEISLGQASTL